MTFPSPVPSGSDRRSPNAALVAVAGSRQRLVTPALVLDLDLLEANIAAMATLCREAGIALRPHAKTHKCVEIARRQLCAGAAGICCATVGEAEVMTEAGIDDLLVTSPVVPPRNIDRLLALRAKAPALKAVVDHPDNVAAIAARARELGVSMDLLVDFDVGLGRTGAASCSDALALARQISTSAGLRFAGVQAYAGQLQHIEGYADRRSLVAMQNARMAELVAALRSENLAPSVVSGGGTGTHAIDAGDRVLTELQAGSYAVMDVEYADVELEEGASRPRFANALFVRSTVISTNAAGMVTTDAGLKRFATDGPRPRIARGAPDGAVYGYSGDEHGCIVFADASQTLPLGAAVECVVPHCDPTVNLYDEIHVVRGDDLVAVWKVDARGA